MIEDHLHCQTLWLIFQIIPYSFLPQYPKIVPFIPVERKIDCTCRSHFCKRKLLLRLGWASTIRRFQGMTIGDGGVNKQIVINPGTRAFESRSPGALFVALSRAKSTGKNNNDSDFALHPSFLVNEDRVCHCVNTPNYNHQEQGDLQSIAKETASTFNIFQTNQIGKNH